MMTLSPLKTLVFALTAQVALGFSGAAPVQAQNLFAPAFKVNDKIITEFELKQRALMLQVFRSPGDPTTESRKQLVEERLKLDAAEALGVVPTAEEVTQGMAEFAARASMTTDEFVGSLKGAGIEESTFRDFIVSGISWRTLVRAKFGARVEIGENDIDLALSTTGVGNVRVLLSEVILPAPPEQAAAAQARAEQISQLTSIAAFANAARQSSASATRERGGKLDWMPLSNLPPALHSVILGLRQGQVTDPIPIDGGIALFQLRGLEEGKVIAPEFAAIEYAAYYIAGGRTPQGLAAAQKVKDSADTCDDLYGIAKGQPEEVLERGSKAPADIPTDIAMELAKLDKHEVSTALTRSNGETLVFLMLCGRTTKQAEDVDRNNVGRSLQNRRLASFADGYLAQLRDEARIIEY